MSLKISLLRSTEPLDGSSAHSVFVQSLTCVRLCGPMDCSTPGFPDHHQLQGFTQTHVHRVGDAIQASHPLMLFSSCLQSFPASGSFPMSRLFSSGGQRLGASASAPVLPMDIQILLGPFGKSTELASPPVSILGVYKRSAHGRVKKIEKFRDMDGKSPIGNLLVTIKDPRCT